MSRINAIRMINVNYNNDTIRIDDEIFQLGSRSTLFSLKNGGGKSVFVQMVTSLFVHNSRQNTTERPFSSYFNTNRPTFILVEWELDGKAGYVLTGMMVRKNQAPKEDGEKEELEMIRFISEYKNQNEFDIQNIPIVECSGKEKKLKGFSVCRQLFEQRKQDMPRQFDYFEMSNRTRSRAYFERLSEYQIYYKEWESIIKKVNIKESGLSELFKEAKDEKGLTEKWFLPAVEDYLNKENNRMKEFGKLVKQYIEQYKKNKSSYQIRETIVTFQKETDILVEKVHLLKKNIEDREAFENRIANVAAVITELLEEGRYEENQINEQIETLVKAMNKVKYEEKSFEIYEMKDKREGILFEMERVSRELDRNKKELDESRHRSSVCQCARLFETYRNRSRELQRYENELEIARKKDEDLAPERDNLGYNLRCFYEKETIEQGKASKEIEKRLQEIEEEKERLAGILAQQTKLLAALENRRGGENAMIKQYDDSEKEFNERYGTSYRRNIVGYYEEGFLEEALEVCKKQMQEQSKTLTAAKTKQVELEEKSHSLDRTMDDLRENKGKLEQNYNRQQEVSEEFEAQLKERASMLQYISLEAKEIFQTDVILEHFTAKINELEQVKRVQEQEMDSCEKEYSHLKSGKILELPKELENVFEKEGIFPVTGMNWMKNNGKTVEENQKLVEDNPFLPYSVIMTRGELGKLKDKNLEIFTTSPVPIIERDKIETPSELKRTGGGILSSEKIHFYVLFNKHLLDEAELVKILKEKEEHLNNLKGRIERRREEISFYRDKQNTVKYQTITEEKYKNCNRKVGQFQEMLEKCNVDIAKCREAKDNSAKRIKELESEAKEINQMMMQSDRMKVDLEALLAKYKAYLQHRKDLVKLENEIGVLKEDSESVRLKQEKLNGDWREVEQNKMEAGRKQEILQEKLNLYQNFKTGTLLEKDIEDIEAKYIAISQNFGREQLRLEEEVTSADKRFQEAEKELLKVSSKNNVEESEYKELRYDSYLMEEIDRVIDKLEDKKSILNTTYNDLDKKTAVLDNSIENEMRNLERLTGERELLPRNEIVERNFQGDIIKMEREKKESLSMLKSIQDKINYLQENDAVLKDFDFQPKEKIVFEENLKDFNKQEWNEFRGRLLRDYRANNDKYTRLQQDVNDEINQLLMKEKFLDEFFHKPLERLYDLRLQPVLLLEQHGIITGSFQALTEKLDVDIALIEKEKTYLMELLFDYLKEVHDSLQKIDRNSRIHVRGRDLKMLAVKVPIWEEQEPVYRVKLDDFLNQLTRVCVELLEENKNIEEMIGNQITTRYLYDYVVGTSNVQIKLYKIEEQKEYPITWEQVAKNSGGEGFLSAFVILSSLLSFMRRDSTDLFMEREEGKVLIMDNPFAQTNASHLLKPIMDLARKNNTQLICLSGLGGESIYNRFDNIYALVLNPSNIKNGKEYLKSRQIKGEEEVKVLVPARVEVEDAEQLELLF
ncbi:coiled-coil domain-containing protein [Anaeromicropila populeti]|uniref:Chromosome segregation ATPase n=1 Tax=Anaeromicropila populeti TaxID=37658 RepID=A0A1I6K9U0_9FIRM|nr:hypothetical protein [Anaeromicropila populeti]SFR87992.1 hypothetical protein SAMN05661086_02308 [Anaeromicropila populeti]